METAFPGNLALFTLINASQSPPVSMVLMARGFASYSPWLVIVVLVLYWLFGTAATRRALMIAGVALGFGLAVNFLLGVALYIPRPFALGIGHNYLAHVPDSSFPSDHATFLWSLGLGLLLQRRVRWVGLAIVLLGVATAWARIYLGVHFPLDMAASLVIALSAAGLALALAHKLEGLLFEPVERLNARLLSPILRSQDKTH